MKKPLTNMRVLLLAALATTVFGDGHELVCGDDCTAGVYTKVAEATAANLGYVDGDMAVYAYLLYQGWAHAGAAGADWVDGAMTTVAAGCATANGKRAEMVKCFNDATAEDVDKIKAEVDGIADASEKAGAEMILGALANQLAPGSEPAKKWGGLDAATFEAALKVYYIVGAFGTYIVPIIESTFSVEADKTACYTQLYTALGYEAGVTGKQDLAYLIATKPEGTLFGADGLKNAACYGTGSKADTWTEITLGDGAKATFADVDELLAATDAGLAEGQKAVAAAKEAAKETAEDPESTASPAAALSALVATVALML